MSGHVAEMVVTKRQFVSCVKDNM